MGINLARLIDCRLIEQLVQKVHEEITPLLKLKNNNRSNLNYIARKCLRNQMITKNIIIRKPGIKADKGSVIVVVVAAKRN